MILFDDGNTLVTMKDLDISQEYAFNIYATILAYCKLPMEIEYETDEDRIREKLNDEQSELENLR